MARQRRRLGKKRHDQIWVPAVGAGTALASSTVRTDIIVAGADWADASTGLERATLMGIRGWVSIATDFTANALAIPYMAIAIYHEDAIASIGTLNNASEYTEDILWTAGAMRKDGNLITEGPRLWFDSGPLNIKARRRFHDQQAIMLITTLMATSGRLAFVLRALIRRD